MSKSVEERVVSMRFDNAHFEKNANASLGTIEKLKKSLNFVGASKGLEDVSAAAGHCNMAPLSRSVEAVSAKFSALQVMAVTTLANITNSAVDAGKRMVSALTIDPIKTGFSEYETKINAVQTIMSNTASKGTTMADVTQVLEELNAYADKTIYNFAEMTRNIGTFTAAGVGLEEAASAIQGIANLAAASGSTSQQASTAMYQLSQALAAGTVKLMDWNSVVNAGMGGEKFQEALKATAREHGVAVDQLIKDEGSFRDSLQKGWITAEILNETLSKFTVEGATAYANKMKESGKYTEEMAQALIKEAQSMEDAATKVKTFTQLWDTLKESAQSGWSQTWETVVGDFEEAKESLTAISDLVGDFLGKSAESRNAVLDSALMDPWKQLSKQITATGLDVTEFKDKLLETAEAHGIISKAGIEAYGGFEKSIKKGWLTADLFSEVVQSYIGGMDGVSQSTEEMTKKLEYFQKVVTEVWRGNYKNGRERIEALTTAGYDYATVQDLVNKTVDGHKLTLNDLNVAQMANLGFTKAQIKVLSDLADQAKKTGTPLNELINNLTKPSGRELLMGSLTNTIKALIKVLETVKTSWNKAFSIDSGKLYNFIEALNKFTESLIMSDETASKLGRTFDGLFAIIDIITTVVGSGLKFAVQTLCKLLGLANVDILSLTAYAGDAIVNFRDWLFETNALAKGLDKCISWLRTGAIAVKEWVQAFWATPEVQAAISSFGTEFSKVFDNIGKYLSGGLDRIREFINRVKSMDSFSLENIKTALKDFKENVIDYFIDLDFNFDSISAAFIKFKTKIVECLSGMSVNFDSLKTKLSEFLAFAKSQIPTVIAVGLGATLIAAIAKISDTLSLLASPFEGISDLISGFADSLKGLTKALAFQAITEGVKNIAIAVGILAAAVAVLAQLDQKAVWSSVGAISLLVIVLGGVVAGLMALLSQLAAMKVNLLNASGSIALLSVALLLFVGCLAILERLDPDLALTNSILLVSVVGSLVLLTAVMGKIKGGFSGETKGLLAMAAALLVLTVVVKLLGEMESTVLAKGIIAVGLLMAFCGGLIALSEFAGPNVSKAGVGILAISAAMLIMTIVIKQIGEMDTGAIAKGVVAIGAFSVFCGALMALSQFAGANAAKAGLGILAISAAMILMVQAIKMIDKLDEDALKKGTAVIGAFSAFCAALIAVTKFAGEHAAKAGLMLLMISGSILILVGAIHLLKDVPVEGLTKAVSAIGTLMILFAGLIAVTKLAQSCKATLIILTVAVGILAGAIAALSYIDASNLMNASKSLSMVVGVFGLLIAATSLLKGSDWLKTMGTVLVLTIMVGALATVIAMLAKFEAGSALESAKALSLLVVSLSASIVILSLMGTRIQDALLGVAALLAMAVPLIAFVGVLATMQNIKNALANAAILTALATAMTVLLVPLTLIGLIITASSGLAALGIAALLAMAVPLIAFVGVLATMQNVKNALNNTIVLTALAAAMTALLIPLALVGVLGPSALIGVAALTLMAVPLLAFVAVLKTMEDATLAYANVALLLLLMDALSNILIKVAIVAPLAIIGIAALGYLSGFLIAMGGVVTAIGALTTEFPKLEKFLTNGIRIFEKLARGLGSIIGNFVSGFASGVTSGLPDIADDLTEFMENIQPFVDGARDIKDDAIKGVKNLASMILAITGAGMVESIVDFISGGNVSLTSFSDQLVPFGEGMKGFADAVEKIDVDAVNAAAAAASAIAKVAENIQATGGLEQLFSGEKDMSAFIDQLVPFGVGMKTFADVVAGIDSKSVKAAAGAAKSIAEVMEALPASGGLAGLFTGEKDMGMFAEQLIPFGEGLNGFSKSVVGIDNKAISSAAEAAEGLASVVAALPKTGGLGNLLIGDADAAFFTEQLIPLGQGMKDFGTSVDGINVDAISSAAEAADAMKTVFKKLNKEGGVAGWFSGEVDLANLSTRLAPLGRSLKGFATAVAEIDDKDITAIEDSTLAVEAIKKVLKTLPKEGGVGGWFGGNLDLASLATNLVPFAEGIKGYANIAAEITDDHITSISDSVSAAEAIKDVIEALPTDGGWFNGNVDVAGLAGNIVPLGDAFKAYASSVADLDTEAITSSAEAARGLASVINALPSEGGAVGWFFGEANMSGFLSQLVPFGEALNGYAGSVTDLNATAIADSAVAAKCLFEALRIIPKDDGFAGWFSGDIDMAAFSDQLVPFGTALSGYSSVVSGMDPLAISSSATAVKGLAEVINALPSEGGYAGWLFGDIDMSKFSDQLVPFGQAIVGYASAVSGLDSTAISDSVAAIQELCSANISGLVSAFENADTELKEPVTGMMDTIVGVIEDKNTDFTNAGKGNVTSFAVGIQNGLSVITVAVSDLTKSIVSAVKEAYADFNMAGRYVVAGFALGIKENAFAATNAARDMARAAYESARKAIDSHSPSRLFEKLGITVPQGFAGGIEKLSGLVGVSATSMADAAINSTKNALDTVYDLTTKGDHKLTITPVVDMSSFDTRSAKLLTNVDASFNEPIKSISQVMAESQSETNRSNFELLTAINGLRDDINAANAAEEEKEVSLYVDGKKLASSIAKPMNRQLQILSTRGAY